jgi:hypothetical protein
MSIPNKNVEADASETHESSHRRGSLVVDHKLANEEDAAVLAKMG